MQHISAPLGSLLPASQDPATREMIDYVLDIVRAYAETPSLQARQEVRMLTNGKMRALAFASLPSGDPVKPLFDAMLADLIADDRRGIYVGWQFWPLTDLSDSEAFVQRHEGNAIEIRFPVRYPWSELPDPDSGFVGVRAEPIFRSHDERHKYDVVVEEREQPQTGRHWWEPNNYDGPGSSYAPPPPPSEPPPDDVPW